MKAKQLEMDWEEFNRKFSFLRPGWWVVHLLGISTVYALGNWLWK